MKRIDCFEAIAGSLSDELVITNLANTANEWRAVRDMRTISISLEWEW